jgi:multidrug transporter EmrE-like cation transporter
MKKLILFLAILVVSFAAQAQALTKSLIKIPAGATYYKYTGIAADTLTTNQDSIIFFFQSELDFTTKVNVGLVFTKRSGNDTIVTVRLAAKYFNDEAYTATLASGSSGNVESTTGTQKTVSYATATGYRYYRVSLQLIGMKSTGVKLKSLELKFVKQ